MAREMRRKKQELSIEEIRDIFERGSSGVLALDGGDGYPYAVPLNYVYDKDAIYFHCAKDGHKLEAIRKNPRASFCVIDQDAVVPAEYTSYYRSAIAFGTVRIMEGEDEKREAIEKLGIKYAPDESREHLDRTIVNAWPRLCMLELRVERMSGKQAIELVKR